MEHIKQKRSYQKRLRCLLRGYSIESIRHFLPIDVLRNSVSCGDCLPPATIQLLLNHGASCYGSCKLGIPDGSQAILIERYEQEHHL